MTQHRYELIREESWPWLSPAIRGLDADLKAVEAATSSSDAGTPTVANMPAGFAMITSSSTRPTARTDIPVIFTGASPGGNKLAGDLWMGSYELRENAELLARVQNSVEVTANGDGSYTKPASGTPVYVLSDATTTALPADWEWAISPAEWLTTSALGTIRASPLATDVVETDVSGDATSGDTPTHTAGVTKSRVPPGKSYARSEVVMYESDYTNYRPVETERVKISFDVRVSGVKALTQQGNNAIWLCVHQILGRSISGGYPHAPISIMIEGDVWKLKGQPGSVALYGVTTYPYVADGQWFRYEEDVLLGRTATGTISAWMDEQPMCVDYKPKLNSTTDGYGTFYAGTGDNTRDLSFVYLKTGAYMGTQAPLANEVIVETRHKRLTWTYTNASTYTVREASPLAAGTNRLHRRNSATGIASPIL